MRSFSTPESALKLEITKLAIVECVIAVALYVSIALYLGTFRYLAIAVVVAPLMLFRTEASAEWGLKTFGYSSSRLVAWLGSQEGKWSVPFLFALMFLVFCVVGLTGGVIRIGGTLYWAVRRPLQTLGQMPENWVRQSFCTDFVHPPEILPLEAAKGGIGLPRFSLMLGAFKGLAGTSMKALWIVIASPLLVLGYVPSTIYRVSFKATAIAYTPIIWAAHATLRSPLSLKMRLERITKGELEKVRRWFSGIVATALLTKIGLVLSLVDLSKLEEKFPSHRFVETIVVPNAWPWWQITLGTDALLTFCLLFFADSALARIDGEQAWREDRVSKTASTVSFVRAVLSIATISHFFFIALVSIAPASLHRLLGG